MRIVLYGLGGAVALVVLALIAFVAVGTLWPGVIEGAPPKIAAGIEFRSDHDPSPAFDARLHQRFPPDTPENVVRAELEAEGFSRGAGESSWHYAWGVVCAHWLFATWTTDRQGRITRIEGSHEYRCV